MNHDNLVQRALHLLAQPIERVTPKEALRRQRAVDPVRQDPVIGPGAFITWTRGDGSVQEGFVDFLYVDATGARWVFVSLLDGTWAAVNTKFVKEPAKG